MKVFDFTNPVLAIIGDTDSIHTIALKNNAGFDFVDPTTNEVIPALGEIEFQIKGAMGLAQFEANIAQINELAQYKKLEYTTEIVNSE